MPEPIVSLRGLSKRFPVRRTWIEMLRHPFRTELVPVVQSVSCDIGRGEFFGLLGPNGAGKTTLFKMLATLVQPDAGTAVIAGHDILRNPHGVRQALAPVIASERSLLWRLSARENLNLYAALQRLPRSLVRQRVDELLHVVELADTGNKMVGQFSSGMKQRLLIARALLSRPQLLLLDEPTRSLDPVSARRFREFLKEEIVNRQGCTVLLATHTAEEALELCDRVGVLAGGKLLAVGTAEALSREVGEERYRLWTTAPAHRCIAGLATQGVISHVLVGTPAEDNWTPVGMAIPGGYGRAAHVVAYLAENGVPIARFERVPLSLADLIDRVVQQHQEDGSHA